NEPSWLDWTEGALSAGLAPYVVQWPTTRSLWEGGIKGDAYRTIHPDPVTHPGFTWTPRPSEKDTKDRLDLTLYTLSPNTEVKSCQVIGENTETSDIVLPNWGPFEEVFDHRGLRTEFVFTK
ncbi:endonuclease/exonuclease/phosphatase family protein, partial [Escherichia coli]|nr:endonuclease/exonuclease/phosphatase family protein [Escherichia coli]